MASTGTIALKEIWRMLDSCAPGNERRAKPHNWWVIMPGGRPPYPSLPLGPHGNRENPDIQVGHVKKMVRSLGIRECAEKFFGRKF